MSSFDLKSECRKVFDFPADRVWEILSDTDHLNRFLKLPQVTYEAPAQKDGVLFRVAVAPLFAGLRIRWIEYPFEWLRGKSYSVVREYFNGPVHRIRISIETIPIGSKSEVLARCEAKVRWKFLHPVLKWVAGRMMAKMIDYAANTIATRGKEAAMPSVPPVPADHVSDPALIRRTVATIGAKFESRFGIRLSWLNRLTGLLLEGTARQVLNLRPFELARDWSTPRLEVLEFFLHATENGAFELDWQLQCPNCQVAKAQTNTLKGMASAFHCDLCGIDIETDLAESVELRFRIHPRLRQAVEETYCLMGPYQGRHIFAQMNLNPGETRPLPSGAIGKRCRIVGEQKKGRKNSVTVEAGSGVAWADEWVASGSANTIRNNSKTVITVVLEIIDKDPYSVSAAFVTSLQTFRKLFGSEVLAVGAAVAVRHLTFLFSDLKDSTALYKSVGDAAAFGRVQKHFVYLEAALTKYEGALVKTMGDAIMAVFSNPQKAMECALAMQEGLEKFNRANRMNPPIVLKLGLHCGPSIAIQNDGILDYFGTTVNYAARIQAQSWGGDIVLSRDFQEAIGRISESPKRNWKGTDFIAELKGIGKEESCLRLVPVKTEDEPLLQAS